MTFLKLLIHNIVTLWMNTLIVSWACVYSWEPMEDSGFGLHWCLTTVVLLVPFGSKIEMCNTGCLHIQTWLQCFLFVWLLCDIMVVVCGQALGGRLSISNHHTGSTVVRCGSCFAMERLTAAYACTNLMLPTSLSMNLHLVTIRHFNIFRPSSETFKTFKNL